MAHRPDLYHPIRRQSVFLPPKVTFDTPDDDAKSPGKESPGKGEFRLPQIDKKRSMSLPMVDEVIGLGGLQTAATFFATGVSKPAIHSMLWHPDGKHLFTCLSNGEIEVFSEDLSGRWRSFDRFRIHRNVKREDGMPCTGICMAKNDPFTITVSGSHGEVQHWEWDVDNKGYAMQVHNLIGTVKEPGNEILAVDTNIHHNHFASAGSDKTVRIYDAGSNKLFQEMKATFDANTNSWIGGHNGRIFSVKFSLGSPHILMSAGWQSPIQVYDLRQGGPVRSLPGSHISGNSMDVTNERVVTGSYRTDQQIQMWNYFMGHEYDCTDTQKSIGKSYLHAVVFTKDGRGFWVAASQGNAVYYYDLKSMEKKGEVLNLPSIPTCMAANPTNASVVAVGTAKGGIYILSGSGKKKGNGIIPAGLGSVLDR